MRRTLRCLTSLLLLSGCASARVRPAPAQLFAFHQGFWLNLHQILLAEGRPHRRPVPGPPHDDPRWAEAIAFYQADYSQRFFLDEELARINEQLALEDGPTPGAAVPGPLREALSRVAPAYRESEWAEDQLRSQKWLAAAQGLLARHGAAFAQDVSRVFHAPWPGGPTRVELSKQAGPFGAFSLGQPLLITLSSADPVYQDDAALEMLFHEAAHGLDGPVVQALERACARRAMPVPQSLGHAILFFSVGELARVRLGHDYLPYAYKNGLYPRSPGWTKYEAALRSQWIPYLDGRIELDPAMDSLVAAVSGP